MSLRIDEDKMGPGSGSNNLRGFMLLLMGRVPGSPASDGRFPSSLRPAAPPLQPGRRGGGGEGRRGNHSCWETTRRLRGSSLGFLAAALLWSWFTVYKRCSAASVGLV